MRVGDIVKRYGGRRMMTVAEIRSGVVLCRWFEKTNLVKKTYDPETLIVVRPLHVSTSGMFLRLLSNRVRLWPLFSS